MAEIEVATNGSDTLWIEKGPNGITIGISASDGTSSHHLQVPVTSEEASKAVAFLTEPTDPTLKNEPAIRCQLRAALENMYMFGGMPKPDPNYDSYLNRMIECVMIEVKKGQA